MRLRILEFSLILLETILCVPSSKKKKEKKKKKKKKKKESVSCGENDVLYKNVSLGGEF